MAEQTIFHRILTKEIPASVVYEDEDVLGFLDIHPKAPTHVLFIPKHVDVATINDLTEKTAPVMGKLFLAAKKFAEEQGMANGYRLQVNVGKGGGQEVMYLHLHFQSQQEMKK